MSPPHFYQSNKSLLETVNGLHPMKSAHQTLLDVEPVSKGISEKEYIVAYSNVILCEARKKKKKRKKKSLVYFPTMKYGICHILNPPHGVIKCYGRGREFLEVLVSSRVGFFFLWSQFQLHH